MIAAIERVRRGRLCSSAAAVVDEAMKRGIRVLNLGKSRQIAELEEEEAEEKAKGLERRKAA